MKRIHLLIICAAIVAFSNTANAGLVLQYDSITNTVSNSGDGALGTFNVDSAFVSNELSFIGNDGTAIQGVGSVASFPGGTVPNTATTVNGGQGNQRNTTTIAPATSGDVAFNINPAGALTGSTTDSLAGGNFIFFTFDAAQAFDLTELSVRSDPNTNGNSTFGARTAGAFVSVNGGTFTQFAGDNFVGGNGARTNTFTDTLAIASGDEVEVRFAFTTEAGGSGSQQATRIGSISVEGVAAVPEPSSLTLVGLPILGLCGFRRR